MYSQSLDKLFVWCAENDLMIELGAKDTEYDSDNDVVYLANYEDVQETLYSLLHECGHFLIQNRDDYVTLYRDKVRPQSPTEWYCGFMREEENAWNEGYALALTLALEIDSEAFWSLADACLAQYVDALKGK